MTLLALWCLTPFTAVAGPPPQRVVSLSPSITEILFEIGAGPRVVAVTRFCRYPEAVKSLPNVGGLIHPDLEGMVALKPDLVVLQSGQTRIEEHLARLGLKTRLVDLDTVKDILDTILLLGKDLQLEGQSQKVHDFLTRQIGEYTKDNEGKKPKSVFILLGDSQAPTKDLYAVGKGTFLDELLTLAGGRNILDETYAQYPRISKEFIIQASPEVILEANPNEGLSQAEREKRKSFWNRFSTVRAVRDGNIRYVGAEYILIPGPRFYKIVEEFSRAIYPENIKSEAVLTKN